MKKKKKKKYNCTPHYKNAEQEIAILTLLRDATPSLILPEEIERLNYLLEKRNRYAA